MFCLFNSLIYVKLCEKILRHGCVCCDLSAAHGYVDIFELSSTAKLSSSVDTKNRNKPRKKMIVI